MIRRTVGGLAVVALDETAPEELLRWVRELPEAPAGATADVTWRPASPGAPPTAQRGPSRGWEISGPGHHLPALLQDVLVSRSATLLHACGLEMQGKGVVLVGPTGAGKTLAATAAAGDDRIALLSDDLVVATAGGAVHAFPLPVAIRPYHQELLPTALRSGHRRHARHSALLARAVRMPGARRAGRAVRARLRRRSGAVGKWANLVKTDYLALPTDRLLPPERRRHSTTVRLVVVLAADGEAHVEAIAPAEAAAAALAATYDNEDMAGAVERYGREGLLDTADHHRLTAEAVAAFLGHTDRLIEVRVPFTPDPADARRYLMDAVSAHLPGN